MPQIDRITSSIYKKFYVEMAHKLITDYETPCNHIHGHSYLIELGIVGKQLDQNGMICDFTKLKPFIEQIKHKFDHKTLVYDPTSKSSDISGQGITTVNYNPTAENMANDICHELFEYIKYIDVDAIALSVSVRETENNKAVVNMSIIG